jgi:hypothetical protein
VDISTNHCGQYLAEISLQRIALRNSGKITSQTGKVIPTYGELTLELGGVYYTTDRFSPLRGEIIAED